MTRAAVRAKGEGRWIESPDMARIHADFNNSFDLYPRSVDTLELYDNTGAEPRLLGHKISPDAPFTV